MRTLLWSYLGQRQFPREMSRFEIRHFFTLADADRRELRVRFLKKGRLGAALQLGFLRHRAGQSLGQLLRTTYLCDYFSLPDFRRPLYRVLERGESVNALQRQICTQPLPAKRGRRVEELIATSGALTLLTNCVMAWNTQRLQRALDRKGQHVSPRHLIDALSHIGPVGHKHINLRGIYRFPVILRDSAM